MSADRIRLHGVACRCRIGVPAAERRKRQRILVDVSLGLDLRKAGQTDDLKRSVDYHALERTLRQAAESGERMLLERLAEDLARTALMFDGRVRAVTVAVRKKPAVMPQTREVAVEVRRIRRRR